MKKILGVSFATMLAVTPMMASADDLPTITLLGNPAGTVAAEANVATTSYVKGAYNDLAGKINTDRGAINTLNGSVSTEGSVLKTVKDNAATGSYNAATEYAEGTLGAAIKSAVSTASDTYQLKADSNVTTEALTTANLVDGTDLDHGQGVAANLIKVAQKAKGNAGEITTLKADANTTGSVLNTVKITAAGADYSNATSGLNANTLAGAIDALDTIVDGINTDMNSVATKEGVVATINKSGVTVYQDWNAGGTPANPVTVNVQAGGASHNEYYATVASTTGVAQPEPIVP